MAKTRSNRTGSVPMSNKTRSVLKKISDISRRNQQIIPFTGKDRLKPNAKTFGSVRQVATGFAKKTEGGLKQRDIIAFRRNGKRTFVTRGAHARSKAAFSSLKNKMGLHMPFFYHNGDLVKTNMTYGQFISAPDDNTMKNKIIKHYLK